MKREHLLYDQLLKFTSPVFLCILMISSLCSASDKNEKLITVMNPAVREELAPRVNLIPRLTSLKGKTIYLVDMNYEGIDGTPVMGEVQAWFRKNMPDVKTVLRIKKGNYIADDPELWKEISDKKGDAVIMGVAG